ncbi:unnamed protein product (macronuclear) [Paramecium tetraurelia]|uniref:Transmembrane protein n=1 Tax=Paramecium tetraurelia TaxID=5888 RepID=A0E5D1_PARTE|nr:uncharacterized protein GSPATT00023675001 [Paramecium tetraurelia]CAK90498.1 unnamed protein product [Paramecium tetraurelia]|eukprot:XP_001457895.1 hypothetical protein (macronuclear) [Paramecium tetraurelia strain d4-2]
MKLSIQRSLQLQKREWQEQSHSPSIDIHQNVPSEILNETSSPFSLPIFLMPLIYGTFIFILMIQMHQQQQPQKDPVSASATLKTLQENLASSPILDIQNTIEINRLHRHYQSCPYGFEITTIGIWEGINSGCLCSNGELKERSYCYTHFKSDCQSVLYYKRQQFQYWKGEMYCVEFAQKWKWVGNQDCPHDYYKCANGICISSSNPKCPITDLIETKSQTEKQIKIGSKYFNKYRNGSTPLINFQIVPGVSPNSMCLNSQVQPKFQSGKYYPLNIVPEKGCDKYGNTFRLLVQIVYDDNDFTNFQTIPYFLDYIDSMDTYTLQIMSRITINSTHPECNFVDPNSIKTLRLQGETIIAYSHYVGKISLVLTTVLLITSLLFYLLRDVTFISVDFTKFQHIEYQLVISFILSMSNIALGIIYYTQADGLKGIDGQNRIYHEYQKYNCFIDEGITNAFKEVILFAEHSYLNTEPWVKGCFYGSTCFIVIIAILLFLQYQKVQHFFVKPWKVKLN